VTVSQTDIPLVDEIFTVIQDLFQRGLVIVVGSGASCAYGVPGMDALAKYLIENVPKELSSLTQEAKDEWNRIALALESGKGLEIALSENTIGGLAQVLKTQTAECIAQKEVTAIAQILSLPTLPAFGRLCRYYLSFADQLNVITTNYDRLIEIQAAQADVAVDTLYYGHTLGRFNPDRSGNELLRACIPTGRASRTQLKAWPHLRLFKVHGSLDWYNLGDTLYRSDLAIPGARQIVPPSIEKYRLGYYPPFDAMREKANLAIDNASGMLFQGYGFNDDHLQTHITPRSTQIPSVVLSMKLTDSAREHISRNNNSIGIEKNLDGCTIFYGGQSINVSLPLWDLEILCTEVLKI